MVKNRTIQIRLTRAQYERIKQDAELKGFASMSEYLRFLGLRQDFVTHTKIAEIHAHLLGEPAKGRYKKNPACNYAP